MAGIGIIANPHSKLNKRNPKRQQLLSYIAGEQGRFEITNNLEELASVAREFCEHNIEVLAINGGDGTISRTLTAFVHIYRERNKPLPEIALLRGGTMNMLADNLGIRGTPEQVLYRLIEAHSAGNIRKKVALNSLSINDNTGFLFANGASARFLDEFYKNKTGALGSILLVCRISLSYLLNGPLFKQIIRSEKVNLLLDNKTNVPHTSLSLFASTVDRLPMKIQLFPGASLLPDRFEILSVTFDESEIVRKLPSAFMVFPHRNGEGKMRLTAHTLRIDQTDEHLYTLDGELYHSPSPELEITMGPKISFVVI